MLWVYNTRHISNRFIAPMRVIHRTILKGLLWLFLSAYGVFLSLPFVTDAGYVYLRDTAEKARKEMQTIANELEAFHRQHQRYPHVPASHWITEASLEVNGQAIFLYPPGFKSETIFDPFIADGYTQPVRYYSDGSTWFTLVCDGPDQDGDITEEVFRSLQKPTEDTLREWMYHPENGYRSGGDVAVVVSLK